MQAGAILTFLVPNRRSRADLHFDTKRIGVAFFIEQLQNMFASIESFNGGLTQKQLNRLAFGCLS